MSAVVQLGLVAQPHTVSQVPLIFNRNGIFGSVIGGMQALHDLCAFAAEHSIYLDTKVQALVYLRHRWYTY
jgi:D-arabinose 1-dehydrogenase-like Zn-dependent alcohol dehydrogenase